MSILDDCPNGRFGRKCWNISSKVCIQGQPCGKKVARKERPAQTPILESYGTPENVRETDEIYRPIPRDAPAHD